MWRLSGRGVGADAGCGAAPSWRRVSRRSGWPGGQTAAHPHRPAWCRRTPSLRECPEMPSWCSAQSRSTWGRTFPTTWCRVGCSFRLLSRKDLDITTTAAEVGEASFQTVGHMDDWSVVLFLCHSLTNLSEILNSPAKPHLKQIKCIIIYENKYLCNGVLWIRFWLNPELFLDPELLFRIRIQTKIK